MMPATFTGYCADVRLDKDKREAEVVLRLPIAQGAQLIQSLRRPRPSERVRVAITPTSVERIISPQPDGARPRQRFDEVRPSAQAGMLCARPAFWRFLRERHRMPVETSDQAATAVREICGVTSRRELTPGSEAAARWHELNAEFDVWMKEPF